MNDSLRALLAEFVSDLERRFPYAAVLYTSASGTRASIDNRDQSASLQDPSQGVVFTLLSGESFEEYATSDLEPDHLARDVRAWADTIPSTSHLSALAQALQALIAQKLLEHLRLAHGTPSPKGGTASAAGLERFKTPCQIAPASLSLSEKLERLRDLQSRTRGFHPQIVNARLSYSDAEETKLFIGAGRQMLQEITRISLFASVIVSDGQNMQHNWLAHAGTGGLELIEVSEQELAGVCETTLRLLDAEKIAPGLYDVVSDPTVSGVIAHECFGHGVELDLFPKGRARSAAYFDQRVAAPGVEMYDDPTVPG
ncbi:MAG TPA: metallopeptidase TldD-related protein, partial [Ktedonobacterales bacterium]